MSEAVFAWPIGSYHGWGVRGLGYALNWPGTAVSAATGSDAVLSPQDTRQGLLAERIRQSRDVLRQIVETSPPGVVKLPDAPVFIPLGNDLTDCGIPQWTGHDVVRRFLRGTPTIACPVFEDEERVAANVERFKEYDGVVVASRWNQQVLEGHGIKADLCHEGIDPAVFHPGVRQKRDDGRFRVFSGGKAEWRKGQDIVIEAFKRFAEKHEDAVLVAAWSSPFGGLASDFEGKCPWGPPPGMHIGKPNFGAWLQRAGLKPHQYEIIFPRPNWQMAEVYGSCDVAVFPNRKEGGTNFVAMECMACGVPTVIAPAFGQQDIEDWATYIVLDDALATVLEIVYDEGGNHPERPFQAAYWTWERHCKEMAEIAASV